jgi:hypothetical protein
MSPGQQKIDRLTMESVARQLEGKTDSIKINMWVDQQVQRGGKDGYEVKYDLNYKLGPIPTKIS